MTLPDILKTSVISEQYRSYTSIPIFYAGVLGIIGGSLIYDQSKLKPYTQKPAIVQEAENEQNIIKANKMMSENNFQIAYGNWQKENSETIHHNVAVKSEYTPEGKLIMLGSAMIAAYGLYSFRKGLKQNQEIIKK